MPSKILIISSSFDLTSDYIINKYTESQFFRLNVDKFSDYKFLINEDKIRIKTDNWDIILTEIDAIYYRKPSLPDLNNVFEKEYHSFAHKEIFALIEGIVESYSGKCLSKPSLLRVANNKIVQCSMAKRIGFKTPKSRITNSPKWAQENTATENIVKPISIGTINKSNSQLVVQTNIVDNKIPMEALSYCPSYFQEFIRKDYDLRITIVGEKIFPVKIISTDQVDWRSKNNSVKYEKALVPNDIILKCKQMLSDFNLSFGCFDFVVKDEEYLFLEINANGQWAWIENELNIEISEAIMEELTC